MEEKVVDDLVQHECAKHILSRFTDDFSSEDISFIRFLSFPNSITVTNLDLKDSHPNKQYTRTVESISDLEEEFKRLPENCEIAIKDISGKMILSSRE